MKKLSLSIAAFSVAMSSMFAAQQKNPCNEIESGFSIPHDNTCYPAGYNATANIILNDQIDITGKVSFIYWYVAQTDMWVSSHSHTLANGVTEYVNMYPDFEFKPGFKIGGAIDTKYDDWRLAAEYTWLHQSTHHNFHVATTQVPSKANWKMHLDMLDFGINRALYRSKRITLSPTAGLKALWIRQNWNIEYYKTAGADNYKSHSWAIGPNLSTDVNFLFDYGMRFEGKAGVAVLYTRYTQLSERIGNDFIVKNPNYGAVRPLAELGFGFGWGRYLDNQNYYIDLSARYDFNVFFSQNQFNVFYNSNPGDLYMHGLTLTGRFDF